MIDIVALWKYFKNTVLPPPRLLRCTFRPVGAPEPETSTASSEECPPQSRHLPRWLMPVVYIAPLNNANGGGVDFPINISRGKGGGDNLCIIQLYQPLKDRN